MSALLALLSFAAIILWMWVWNTIEQAWRAIW